MGNAYRSQRQSPHTMTSWLTLSARSVVRAPLGETLRRAIIRGQRELSADGGPAGAASLVTVAALRLRRHREE